MTQPYHLSVIKKRSTKTEAELDAILSKYRDPAYMEQAINGVAEVIYEELFPSDNEVKINDDGRVRCPETEQ